MTLSPKSRAALAGRLRHAIQGDVLHDDFSRGRYATDASPYQSFPALVVLPRTQDDALEAARLAWEAGLPVIARGGGTGRAGQAVGEGLVLDVSKYLTRLLYYDASSRTCIVEPGISPAALNQALRPEQVWFPIETGAPLQATIGGMAATDAIGSRTLLYGRMRDNVAACDVMLGSGDEVSLHEIPANLTSDSAEGVEAALMLDLLETVEQAEDLLRGLPATRGAQTAYNLRALLPEVHPQNPAALMTGSEGTLGLMRRIELKLVGLPGKRAVGICHFPGLIDALRAVERILALEPVDVELTDPLIFELGLETAGQTDPARRLLRKQAGALLLVEFMEGNPVTNARKLKELGELMTQLGHPRSVSELIGPAAQEAARRAHRNGIARLYGRTAKPAMFAPIDQFALPLPRLATTADRLSQLFARYDMRVIWHGQIGTGALHLRPWIMGSGEPAETSEIASEASAIFADFALHAAPVEGFGLARSLAAEKERDPRVNGLLEQVKARFDPANRLNPGKLVLSVAPKEEMHRSQPADPEPASELSALRCDGTALCRRLDKSVMCPSFKITRDERDSPRGRANSLRLALAGELGPEALASDAMAETMKLCVSCKACRSECPRAADIAQAKIAVSAERIRQAGVSRFASSLANLPHSAPSLRRWRHLLNLRDILPWGARYSERVTGVTADRPWPRWSASAFPGKTAAEPRGDGAEIVLLPDTFNNHFDPVTLRAAADVLEASGFRIHVLKPEGRERPFCCGRTFLEAGLVDEARNEARRLILAAKPYIERGIPLVGLEPACLLTIRDEFVNTLREDGARELAAGSLLFEEVMSQPFAEKALAPRLMRIEAEALFAAHCHQRAFGTADLSRSVAGIVPGINVIEADPACCGMGTSFGYDPETVSASFRMGEHSLFPQIRRATRDTLLIADGFACRRQINDGTGRTARHTAVLLKLALAAKEKLGGDAEGRLKKDKRLSKRLNRLRRHYFK